MFGHNEHHEENNLPEPDGHLAAQNAGIAQTDDSSSDYIDDAPGGSTVTPTNDDGLLTSPTTSVTDDATTSGTQPVTGTVSTAAPDTDQLLDIKQQALQQLTPLVGHLEQSDEEKFRTTMMMIQASDNHELIKVAYEAAQRISDEKVRAQALLDIVNEINYFTQNHTETATAA